MTLAYYISSDKIGNQDSDLGKKLMHNFFIKLLEAKTKPSHILLVERGVHLLLPDFTAIEAIEKLESLGVEILACQTCLNHYQITQQIAAGKISNMPTIIETMHSVNKVINL